MYAILLQSLSDCTGSMDASTWNAYHIISNRARSVCYATRQEHFKRQTEVAVNKLSQSTIQQLQTVRELASSHKEIKDFAQESLQVWMDKITLCTHYNRPNDGIIQCTYAVVIFNDVRINQHTDPPPCILFFTV